MKRFHYISVSLIIFLAIFILCGAVFSLKISVFAPWSFEARLRRIVELFEQKTLFVKTRLTLGTPGALIKRIESGERPDVYISMGPNEIEILQNMGLIIPEKQKELMKQTLVLISGDPPVIPIDSLYDLTKEEIKTVGIGRPKLTAGARARMALQKIGLLEEIDKKSKTSPFKSVIFEEAQAAITYEECVYEEDLYKGENIPRRGLKIIGKLPEVLCEPFYITAVSLRKNILKNYFSADFLDFLSEEKARNIMLKKGFYSCPICELAED